VASHLPPKALAEATLTGRRYSGPEAVAAGVAEEVAAEDRVVPRAVELAQAMAGKDRGVIAAHKALLRGDLIRACGVDL
jgi:enoyl-CoA hydratase/carnithine racemase